MPKNKKEKISDNTYGGVRYRFSYDDSRRAAVVRQMRLRRRGSRSFWLAVGMVSVFCFSTLAVSVVYKSIDAGNIGNSSVDSKTQAQAITVSAQVVSEKSRTYPDRFVISEMNDRAGEVYHLPKGVMVSDVCETESTVMDGDIIVAVNGVETSDAESFHSIFTSAEKSVRLNIYRQEKILDLEYVVDHEE